MDEIKLNTQSKYEFINLLDLNKNELDKIEGLIKSKNKVKISQKEVILTIENKDTYVAYYPIKDLTGNLLFLFKIYVPKDMENKIEYMGIVIALTILLFGVLIVLILNFKFSKLINKPLEQIMNNIKDFTYKMENKLNIDLYGRKDEISDLAKSIDILKSEIIAKQNNLEDINRRLEIRVKKRTKELKIKNKEILLSDKILSETLEGVIILDSDKRILKVNKAIKNMFGFKEEDLIQNKIDILNFEFDNINFHNIFDIVQQKGYWRGEARIYNKNDVSLPVWLSATFLQFNGYKVYILILSDISKLKEKEEELEKLAYYDLLTNLPNRNFFMKKLKEIIDDTICKSFALLFIDLDGFKVINDTLGHDIGDKVLINVADRIISCIDKGDIVFRLGEDEFIVLTFNIDNEYKVRDFANKIINEISKPLFINNFDIKASASIGIVKYPKDDITFEGLLRKVDATLYEVKEKEKGGFLFFSQEIEKKIKI